MFPRQQRILYGIVFVIAMILAGCSGNSVPGQVPESNNQQSKLQPTIEIWDTSWIPSDPQSLANAINYVVQGTGLAGQGRNIVEYSKEYGVNPIFALAMFKKEASFAASGTRANANKNPGNIIATGSCRGLPKGSSCNGVYGEIGTDGRFGVYASMSDGIKAYFMLLSGEYKPGTRHDCQDVKCVISIYCPPSDCDTATYIAQITQWMEEYRSQLSNAVIVLAPAPQQNPPSIGATIIGATVPAGNLTTACTLVIEDLSFSPTSPSQIGTTVNGHAKATWNSCFRSMRLKIDGGVVYESGSPEFTFSWRTTGYSDGDHTIELEVAAQGDNNWSNPTTRTTTYILQAGSATPGSSCHAPPIEDLSFNPTSPAAVGTLVNVHAKATWNTCFRSMRLKIDGNVLYELGSPEFTFSWNTTSYSTGSHTVRLEVAAQGDNSWSNPSAQEASYSLQSSGVPTSSSCQAPQIKDLSFNPNSPAVVGSTVNIHVKATSNPCFRSMRLKIDGGIVYELGSPEFTFSWNTNGYSIGSHTIRLEVAAQGDNSWSNPSTQEDSYSLQSGTPPTTPPCQAPPIEDLSFNPGSPSTAGTTVSIHAKATWNSCFRSMRLKIDGGIVYELGSPEFTFNWNTSSYSAGSHTIRLEVAAQGDNSWSNPSVQKATYDLQSNTPPTSPPASLEKPSLVSPSNGALLPPGTDVTLQWNPVSGATQYIVEIWGGQYGGTHATPCGWQNGTSCHIGTMSPGNVLWRVQARDGSGNMSPWSDEWNFTPQ